MKERRARTRARELALQYLYASDLRGDGSLEAFDRVLAMMNDEEPVPPSASTYARTLVEGVFSRKRELDTEIAHAAKNWDLDRMAAVDRNVLRLALYELRHQPDVPPKVAINEAVDLGKAFSTGETGAFVNGILDTLARTGTAPDRAL